MKKFSIYKLISVIAFIALVFILALPNFFDINKKQETEQCIKNMRIVYSAAVEYFAAEGQDFSGTTSDLERMGYLKRSYECPSEAPGDKYEVKIDSKSGKISVRCVNEIKSSPELFTNSFEDFIYFVNILKFHQKPTSEFIYSHLSEEVKALLQEHEAYSNSLFDVRTVLEWDKFIENLNYRRSEPALREIWLLLSAASRDILVQWDRVENPLTIEQRLQLTQEINEKIIAGHEFSKEVTHSLGLNSEGRSLRARGYSDLNQIEKQRYNRILLEHIFPFEFQEGTKYNYPVDELKELLVENINVLMHDNVFNDKDFINEIKLSGRTVKQLEKQPESRNDIILSNRLLLQDAYPSLLVRYEDEYSDHRLPVNY